MSMSPERLISDETKLKVADRLGFGEKVRQYGWRAATTEEVGLMVRELLKTGEKTLTEEEPTLTEGPHPWHSR